MRYFACIIARPVLVICQLKRGCRVSIPAGLVRFSTRGLTTTGLAGGVCAATGTIPASSRKEVTSVLFFIMPYKILNGFFLLKNVNSYSLLYYSKTRKRKFTNTAIVIISMDCYCERAKVIKKS